MDDLAREQPDTRISWLLRRGAIGDTFGGGQADELPARGALGLRAKAAVEAGRITVVTRFRADTVEHAGDDRLVLTSLAGQ